MSKRNGVWKVPASVRVGAVRYKILASKEPDGNARFAETNHVECEIRIAPTATRGHLPSTLLHEIIHAVSDQYGVGLKESQVKQVANGLAQALIDLGLLPEGMSIQ